MEEWLMLWWWNELLWWSCCIMQTPMEPSHHVFRIGSTAPNWYSSQFMTIPVKGSQPAPRVVKYKGVSRRESRFEVHIWMCGSCRRIGIGNHIYVGAYSDVKVAASVSDIVRILRAWIEEDGQPPDLNFPNLSYDCILKRPEMMELTTAIPFLRSVPCFSAIQSLHYGDSPSSSFELKGSPWDPLSCFNIWCCTFKP
jgi:hypothetical protein